MTLIIDTSQTKYQELQAVLQEQEGDYQSALSFYSEYALELKKQEKSRGKLWKILNKKA